MLIGDMSEVEALKSALVEAKKEADEERAACRKHEARLDEVQQELTDAISKCESLERKVLDRDSELATTLQSVEEARVEAQDACQEIREAKQIAAGKDFNMQSKFVRRKYTLLTHIWSSPGAFADLPRSIAHAADFFRANEEISIEKLFWSQYLAPEQPLPFSDQLK